MLRLLLQILGLGLRILPEPLLHGICIALGSVLAYLPGRRRHLLASLYRVYPHWSEKKRRQHARRTAARTIEMGIIALVSPFWSKTRCQERIHIEEGVADLFADRLQSEKPQLLLTPHLSLTEAGSWVAAKMGIPPQHLISLYRPLKNRALDAWVRRVRSRFGLVLTSRKDGYTESIDTLRQGRWLVLLFDQHAGDAGALIAFCNQVASATTLPETLRRKTGAEASILWVERSGFGRGNLRLEALPDSSEGGEAHLTLQAHHWLERKLLEDPPFSENWLWLHRRWKIRSRMRESLTLRHRRRLLDPAHDFSDHSQRRLGCRVRLPADENDAHNLLPVVRAIRKARPDFLLTVVGPADLAGLSPESSPPWDHFESIPRHRWHRWLQGWKARRGYPEISFLFDSSASARLEALLSGCPHRWGWISSGQSRWGLTGTATRPTPESDQSGWVAQHLESFGWLSDEGPSPQ